MKTTKAFKPGEPGGWPFQLPVDGWYQLAPFGRFPNTDQVTGKTVIQVIDQEAAEAILADFETKAAAENFSGVLVDYDHFSHDQDKTTEAAGWIFALKIRPDGLWFQVRWSAKGETNLKAGCYRHISPVFNGAYISDEEVRPLQLDRAALTNDPNLKGMRPLSNRGGGESTHISHRNKENESMNKKLLALLGLSADASEDAAVGALTNMKNRAESADQMKTRAETAEAKVKKGEQAQLKSRADAFCTQHAARIENREAVHAQYLKDPDGTEALFAGLKAGKEGETSGTHVPLHNRQTKQPDGKTSKETTPAQQLEEKVQVYIGQNRCTYQAAFAAVSRAHPELLKTTQA